jgi:hypothetical protein
MDAQAQLSACAKQGPIFGAAIEPQFEQQKSRPGRMIPAEPLPFPSIYC